VAYDDDEEEWMDLSKETIKWVDGAKIQLKANAKPKGVAKKTTTTSRGRVRFLPFTWVHIQRRRRRR
jgi:hypothetical protein